MDFDIFKELLQMSAPDPSLSEQEKASHIKILLTHLQIKVTDEKVELVSANLAALNLFRFSDLLEMEVESIKSDLTKTISDILAPKESKGHETDELVYTDAFNADYEDPKYLVNRFHRHLGECLGTWSKTSHYSPYVALVQSSGTGKSRLIRELSKKGVYVIYVCLRDIRDTGYPARSELANELLGYQTRKKFMSFLLAALTDLKERIESETDQMDSTDFYDLCAFQSDQYATNIKKLIKEFELLTEGRIQTDIGDTCVRLNEKITIDHGPKIVFAFDEAMSLTLPDQSDVKSHEIPFYCLRQALRSLPEFQFGGNAFAVLTDTSSRTSILSPASRIDSSLRVRDKGAKLFDPFYFCQMDIPRRRADSDIDRDLKVKDIPTMTRLVTYGRPLWFSTMKAGAAVDSLQVGGTSARIMQLAIRKLLRGLKLKDVKDDVRSTAFIAILSSRFCIDVDFHPDLTEQLVSGHMSTLAYVSPNRDYVISRYSSEPILSEAAAHCLWYFSPSSVIESYHETLKYLPSGETGELVARVLLLLSFDAITGIRNPPTSEGNVQPALEVHVRPPLAAGSSVGDLKESIFYTQVRSVYEFLDSLLGSQNFQTLQFDKKEWMKETYICFNHFNRVGHKVTAEDVEGSLKACMAIICQANEYGVDLIIPTHHGDEEVDSNKVDAIFIQVKNRTSYYSEATVRTKLINSYKRVFKRKIDLSKTLIISMGVGAETDAEADEYESVLIDKGVGTDSSEMAVDGESHVTMDVDGSVDPDNISVSDDVFMFDGMLVLKGITQSTYGVLQCDQKLENVLKTLAAHNVALPGKFEKDSEFLDAMFPRSF